MDNVEYTSKAVKLCDELINDCYEGLVSSPVELSSRVREIKSTTVEELDHFREAAKMVVDASALHKALRTLRQRFDNDVMAYQDRYYKFSGWHWHKKAAEAKRWRDVFHELREACDAALSAPPRNCDRYDDEDDAFAAWHDSLNDGDVVSVRNAFDWLFARRKETRDE